MPLRVLLVGPDHESNLSLLYLAASLRAAGHTPDIVRFDGTDDAPRVLAAARRADLVGLSMSFQVRALEFLGLAAALKRAAPNRPVIAGGHHASCAARELLENHPALDAIVMHEGEETLVELANLGAQLAARACEVRGVAARRDGCVHVAPPRPIVADLDRLPRPDRSGPARLLCGVPTAYLMGSRGCVRDCDYCCITTLHRLAPGPRFRQRTPEDVADEMGDLFHRHGVRQFVFHDDNFLVPSTAHNRDRIARLDTALRARGVGDIGIVTKCSPPDADREALEHLRRMGLLRLFMGIESGSACGLASIGRRQTVGDSERALTLCEDLGISTQYTMIIFSPEATVASMLADLDFVTRHPAHPLNYCRAEIYSGTPLETRMIAAGRAEGNYLGRTYRYADPAVARVWETGKDLFAGRCWGTDDLLGRVIRIDHQVAVLKRFYDGARVSELARSFAAWQVDLNLETAALFRELVLACAEAPSADDPALQLAVDDLRRREAPSRQARLTELCEFRGALERYARASIALGQRHAKAVTGGRRRLLGPRHVAAVAAAIGMLGCAVAQDHGVAEAAPPPLDPVSPPPPPEPPPLPPCPLEEEPAPAPPPFREDLGVAEAAPPPLDELRYRHDLGVAEAAPPPLERIRPPVAQQHAIVVTTEPVAPLRFKGRRVAQPFALSTGAGTLSVGAPGAQIAARLCAVEESANGMVLQIEADRLLTIHHGGARLSTPARVVVRFVQKTQPLVLEDPATGARLRVTLGTR